MKISCCLCAAALLFIGLGLQGCGDSSTKPPTPGPSSGHGLDIDKLHAAYKSKDGVHLRVANFSALHSKYPVSTTIWRSDLPLALYGLPRSNNPDTVGVILTPAQSGILCAYPVNANTIKRTKVANFTGGSVRDSCGESPTMWTNGQNISGKCRFATPEEYVTAYFNKPQITLTGTPMWTLESATCHFTEVDIMLAAQKELLNRSVTPPPDTTAEEWLHNATTIGFGLTAYNEVVITPEEASSAAGIFWAHPGPFREPHKSDGGACQIAEFLASSNSTLPIFEAAGVNLERPFAGCWLDSNYPPTPAPDCLSRGVREWNANLTGSGGTRDPSSVFRPVSDAAFHALLADCRGSSEILI